MNTHTSCTRGDTCIEFNNVQFAYNGVNVIENMTFAIYCGEYVGIVGPNGGGKSTILKLMLGLLEPTHGTIRVLQTRPQKLQEQYKIGYVPQGVSHVQTHFPATVDEIVRSGRTPRMNIFQRFTSSDRKIVDESLEKAGIQALKHKLINDLSGGERQKVFIARALASQPNILILDEPTVGVDPTSRERFYSLLSDLHKNMGLTIIFVTHDTDVIAREAETILCINKTATCHEPSGAWRNREHTEHLYGKGATHIHHNH